MTGADVAAADARAAAVGTSRRQMAQAATQSQGLSPQPVVVCATCGPGGLDCKAALATEQKRVEAATRESDPVKRNKTITQAYRDLADKAPTNQWIRLGSYVSAQAGCAMQTLQGSGFHGFEAQTLGRLFVNPNKATEALGAVNKQIFSTIFPIEAFIADHGTAALRACAEREGWTIPSRLQRAADLMDAGQPREAANQIALYEQQQVVPPVYKQYESVFRDVERGNTFDVGHDNLSIPLSYTCGEGTPVPFSGSIQSGDDRVNYYSKLMDALQARGGR